MALFGPTVCNPLFRGGMRKGNSNPKFDLGIQHPASSVKVNIPTTNSELCDEKTCVQGFLVLVAGNNLYCEDTALSK